jgi:hypothetical protein
MSGFVFQCSSSKKDTTGKSDYNPYFPAAEENYWEYINEAPRKETELWKVEVKSMKSEGNGRIYTFSSFPFFSKEEKQAVLTIKENGAVYMNDTNRVVPEVSNLKKDYTWNFGLWNGYVAATNETVKAENQTYTACIHINYAISITWSAEIWLSKNNGIVKWGFFRTNPPSLTFTYYVLKKSIIN